MSQTVWIHQARPRSAWYALDEAQRQERLDVWSALDCAAVERGAQRIGAYSIRGQSDYSTLELWHFDSPEATFDFWAARVGADYAVWFAFANQLGVSTAQLAEQSA